MDSKGIGFYGFMVAMHTIISIKMYTFFFTLEKNLLVYQPKWKLYTYYLRHIRQKYWNGHQS